MKRTKQCPKCQSIKIGYLPEQPDADDVLVAPKVAGIDPSMPAIGSQAARSLPPRTLGLSTDSVESGFWQHGTVTPLIGRLEAYVCTDCGYHETYVASPAAVPWKKLVGFVLINEPGARVGPYR